MPEKKVSGEAKLIVPEDQTRAEQSRVVKPGDVVVKQGEPYYCGGTVSRRAPAGGVVMKEPHDPSY